MADKLLVRPAEAAAMLSVSKTRLYELIQAGELAVVRVPSMRVEVRELERWIERQRANARV